MPMPPAPSLPGGSGAPGGGLARESLPPAPSSELGGAWGREGRARGAQRRASGPALQGARGAPRADGPSVPVTGLQPATGRQTGYGLRNGDNRP